MSPIIKIDTERYVMIGPGEKVESREEFETDEFLNDDEYINMMIDADEFNFRSADDYEDDEDDEESKLLRENGY